MYVFDLLCGTLCVASVLLWARGRWILSFLAFWLAYKSKELAVMLPAVLVLLRVVVRRPPLVAAGSVPGGIAVVRGTGAAAPSRRGGDYSFHFTRDTIAATAPFYAGRCF